MLSCVSGPFRNREFLLQEDEVSRDRPAAAWRGVSQEQVEQAGGDAQHGTLPHKHVDSAQLTKRTRQHRADAGRIREIEYPVDTKRTPCSF